MAEKYESNPARTNQNNAVYGGLIAISLIIVQAFLTLDPLDVAATISVMAFAVALPLLVTLVLLNNLEAMYAYASVPGYLIVANAIAILGAFVGIVAAFWHVSWLMGTFFLVSALLGLVVYGLHYDRLRRDNRQES